MKRPPSFLSCSTSLLSILLLAGFDLGTAKAEEVAVNLPPESTTVRREELLGVESNRAEILAGVVQPSYNVSDFISPVLRNLDELVESAGKSELVQPAYTPELFTSQAIAQANKAEPLKPIDDDIEELKDVEVKDKRRVAPERRETTTKFEIKRDEITATGATTVSEALTKLAPGFFGINSLGGVNTDQGVFLRGLGSNRFLVLIDGRPTTRPSNNRSADLGRLGVSNIERIELVTGGAGLRYGAGAIAGAINIITRLPDEEKLAITVEGGSYGFNRDTVNYTNTNGLKPGVPGYIGYELNYERRSALNNYTGLNVEQPTGLGIRLSEGQGRSPEFFIPPFTPSEVVPDEDGERVTFYKNPVSYTKVNRGAYVFSDDYAAKIIYQPALDHTLRASISVRSIRTGDQFAALNGFRRCTVVPKEFGLSPELGALATGLNQFAYTECNLSIDPGRGVGQIGNSARTDGRGDQSEDNIIGSLGWEWKLTEFNKLTFLGSFSTSFETFPSNPAGIIASSQIYDFQLNYSSELTTNNTLNAGFEYFQQRYNSTPRVGSGGNQFIGSDLVPVNYFAVDISKRSLAFFATDQWRFFDEALIIDLGIRLTDDQFFGVFTTPGAGLRWNFGGPKNQEPFAFRASWFQSFRAPGLAEIFGYPLYNSVQNSSFGPFNNLRNLALKPETGVSYDLGLDIKLSPSSLFRITYFRTDLNNGIVGNVSITTLPRVTFDGQKFLEVYTPEQLERLRFDTPNFESRPPQFGSATDGTGVGNGSFPRINGQVTNRGAVLTTINAQSYLSTGWEFSYKWQITQQLELGASYSFIDSRPIGDSTRNTITDTFSGVDVPLGSGGVNGGFFYGYQVIDIPFTTGNLGLRYSSNRYRVALNASFVGLRPRALGGNNYYLPYNRWDLTFGIPLTEEITFTGGVFNIFNDRSILGDTGLGIGAGVLEAPTTFRVGVDMTFK
jgi:iron complex outermembrane recepter protein